MRLNKSRRHFLDIWPGFVDALATLLMAIIFVLMVFVISQGYMSEVLHGQEKDLKSLGRQFDQLSQLLSLEKTSTQTLQDELYVMKQNLKQVVSSKENDQKNLTLLHEQLTQEEQDKKNAELKIHLLTKQLEILNSHLNNLSSSLESSKNENDKKEADIKGLLQKLNLLEKVNQDFDLAKYRSEFFGKLRESLGNRQDISIRGDRFVFQSEVFFASGSSDLEKEGKSQLGQLAVMLRDITSKFPKDINWILRIDGHTDKKPIKTAQFHSNWELSSNRAISVVRFLISQGVPAYRLAATGFGEFQAIDAGETEEAYKKNRRIEIKLDQF